LVVEHEEEIMRAADQIIDIGPDAGQHGGHLVFQDQLRNQWQGYFAYYRLPFRKEKIEGSNRRENGKIPLPWSVRGEK